MNFGGFHWSADRSPLCYLIGIYNHYGVFSLTLEMCFLNVTTLVRTLNCTDVPTILKSKFLLSFKQNIICIVIDFENVAFQNLNMCQVKKNKKFN